MRKFTVFLASVLLMSFNLAAQNTLIPFGSTWKYLDNGSDQGTVWQQPAFDDASWNSGPAILGYGNPSINQRKEATLVSYGGDPNNTFITTYFRKTLTIAGDYQSFTARLKRDDGAVVYVNGKEVYRSNLPNGPVTYKTVAQYANDNGTNALTFTIPASAFNQGSNVIAVEIHQVSKSSSDMTFDLELTGKPGTTPQDPPQNPPHQGYANLIPFESTWKYLDNGSDQGTAWRQPAFDDASWQWGPGLLGYGNLPLNKQKEATQVSFGPNPNNVYITTYFRKTITLSTVPEAFKAAVRRDDGIVVYVNGVEVFRDHMPKGPVNYKTLAYYSSDNGMKHLTFTIPASAFVVGQNVIAAEVHQHSKSSSDLAFDLELKGKGGTTTPPGDQTAPTVLSINRHDPTSQNTSNTSVTFRAIFSEAVTGVDAADFELAGAASGSIASVNAVSGTTYEVLVNNITGTGELGLNLKSSGTGIADLAANPISGGFTGQTYNIQPPADQTAPAVLSVDRHAPTTQNTSNTSVTFRAIFSEAVTGVDATDFELAGAAAGSIASVNAVSGTTYEVLVNSITGTGELGLNLKSSGTGIADLAANPISGGFTGQTYNIQPPADQTAPTVLSIDRHDPTSQNTSNTSVTFRAIFSEAVTGVDAADFELAGAASGSIASVNAVSGTTYEVLVNNITGTGELGLNLKSNGTGIADLAANPISGGFTGQTYIIPAINNTPGFVSVTPLNSLPSRADATRDKQQAKVFFHANKHWAVIAKTGGTYLWRLDDNKWTEILLLSPRNNRSDAVLDGNLVHILMFGSASAPSQLRTIEYVPATNTYQYWSSNPNMVEIPADPGMETVSLAKDGTGRLWIANEGGNEIHVSSSEWPYTTWTAPHAIATNIDEDDIAAAVYIPSQQRIGVLWSNQNTERFGFSTHLDGTPLDVWTPDEVPAGLAAVDADGKGMADDHLNIKVGSDGTLYCAVKTSYDLEPEIGLLVRRPTGLWDQVFYPVAIEGTLPIVVLNESIGRVRVVYTSATYGGEILYQESSTSNISFGAPIVLITGAYNNATSTHQNFTSDVVILASDADEVVGVLASDKPAIAPLIGLRTAQTELAAAATLQEDIKAFPNPFSSKATLSFALPAGGAYSLTVYESTGMEPVFQRQGLARAGELTQVEVEGTTLARGLYYVRLQTPETSKTLRLILDK